MQIAGARAVVTGAAGVLGRSLSVEIARRGAASVVLVEDDPSRGGQSRGVEQTAALVCAQGALAEVEVADLADEREVTALVRRVEEAGPVDLWCSNASLAYTGGLDTAPEELSVALAVNLLSHVWTARALLPAMVARGRGSFLQTASTAGILPEAEGLALSVGHGAAVAFAEWLATTFYERGVRVSCLFPDSELLAGEVTRRPTAPERDEPLRRGRASDRRNPSGPQEPAISPSTRASALARAAVDAVEAERFYVFPGADVTEALRHKADDPEAWLARRHRRTSSAEALNPAVGHDVPPLAPAGRPTAESPAPRA